MRRVIKIGGRAQGDPQLIVQLAAAAGRGESLAIVHGGGDEVSALQRRLGLEPQFRGGRRVTSAEDLELVRMVLSGATNKRLVAQLLNAGVRAVGLSGEDAGLLLAHVTDPAFGRVGGAMTAQPFLLTHLWSGGFIPVVSPLGRDADDPQGGGLNVNGDDAAAAIAAALGADELLLVADVAGVLNDAGATIPELDSVAAQALIASGVAKGGMAAKLEAGALALRGGVRRVRIGDLRAITDASAGTRLTLSHVPAA
ncbi:MAG: acetylglutamate kinase [Gemmatimonadaceae bacterium]|nr:acetylglutamate kinase [Gemmatimonadaceae bacterium]